MNDLLLRALRSEPVPRPPVWFMRQAGRYLPEYHTVRAPSDFLTVCRTPELAAELTLQPLRRFPFDASIVFNDILVPPAAMGMDLQFVAKEGPKFNDPIRSPADIGRLRTPSVERDMPHVLDTIRLLVRQIDVPLFGFAGAPFTLAAYMIEGQGSENFVKVKSFLMNHPTAFEELLERLTDVVAEYLIAQAEAGAAALQLFDTWAGVLDADDFRRFALAPAQRVLEKVKNAPRIYFARDAGALLPDLAQSGADALALDWKVDLAAARAVLGDLPVMGNLDPVALYGPPERIRAKVEAIIRAAGPRGHIFNLGHGILPTTPIPGVQAAVDAVHAWRWTG